MKTAMLTVVPLALAAGGMAASTNGGWVAIKDDQNNDGWMPMKANPKDVLKSLSNVEGNGLITLGASGSLEVFTVEGNVKTVNKGSAPFEWTDSCDSIAKSAFKAINQQWVKPIQGFSLMHDGPNGQTSFVAHCGIPIVDDKSKSTKASQVLWLTGLVAKERGLDGEFVKQIHSRKPPKGGN